MVSGMRVRLGILLCLMLLAGAAAGQTIYKYRRADGQTLYSSERLHGLELIESFEYRAPPAASPQPGAAQSTRDAEERIRRQIERLNLAWDEVRDAQAALAEAEARLRAGIEPQEAEPRQLGGAAEPAPPEVGGPAPRTPPAVGGPGPTPPAAIGGPMGTRQGGGGRSPEYAERMGKLEADVAHAKARLERAIQRYNALR
jgi:hypothetical protein